MYINNGNGKYEEYTNKEVFPKGYEINKEKSRCEDSSGEELAEIKDKISQDGNKITVKSNKTVYCTLYFDKQEEVDNIKIYIKEEKEEKYTNQSKNTVHIEYTTEGEEYTKYCISEEENSAKCVWKELAGKELEEEYTFTNETNEEKKVYAYLKDDTGYIGTSSDTIIYDNTIPEIEGLTISGSDGSNSGYTITVNAKGTINYKDNLSGVESYCISNNSNDGSKCTNWNNVTNATTMNNIGTTLASGDGTGKVVYAFVKDKAGNISEVKTSNALTLDTGKPADITLNINSDTEYTKDKTVIVTIKDTSVSGLAEGSIKYGWSTTKEKAPEEYTTVTTQATEGTNTTTFEANGSGFNGEYYLWVEPIEYKDKAGNKNTTIVKSSGTYKYDNEGPVISNFTITGSEGSNPGYAITVNVTGTITYGDDSSTIVAYCINSSNKLEECKTWTNVSNGEKTENIPITLPSGDGTNKVVYAFVKDKAGNVSEVKTSNALILDTKAPNLDTFTITGSTGSNSGYSITVNATGKMTYSDPQNTSYASGVEKYCVSNTSNDVSKCTTWSNVTTESITTTLASGDGANKVVYAFVKDKAGNTSVVKTSNTLTLDTTKPSISAFTIVGSSGSNEGYSRSVNATGTITYSDTDGSTGVESYCLSNSSTNVNNCSEWIDVDNETTMSGIAATLEAKDGINKVVYAFVKDKAGNTSAVKTSNGLKLDRKSPSLLSWGTSSDGSISLNAAFHAVDQANDGYSSGLNQAAVSARVPIDINNNKITRSSSAKFSKSSSSVLVKIDGINRKLKGFTANFISVRISDEAGNVTDLSMSFTVKLGGSGTSSDPYHIYYIEDLMDLQVAVNNGTTYEGQYFALDRSLDFKTTDSYEDSTRTDYDDINGTGGSQALLTELTSGTGWKPIGYLASSTAADVTVSFQGIFDGKDNTISNLYINYGVGNARLGLFGNLNNGTIKNLTVTGSVTTTKGANIGGILGVINGNSVVSNCKNYATVKSTVSTMNTGGVIGADYSSEDEIIDCVNYGEVSSGKNVAGILGFTEANSTTKIINCVNEGTITNTSGTSAAGIVGRIKESLNVNIQNCYNTGTVTTGKNESQQGGGIIATLSGTAIVDKSHNTGIITSYNAGGIIGTNDNVIYILNSYNTGEIKTARNGGGMAAVGHVAPIFYILNSYNLGNISATNNYAGGILGVSAKSDSAKVTYINNVYNTGTITGTNKYSIAYSTATTVTITNAYYKTGLSGSNKTGTTAMEDADMKLQTFVDLLNTNKNGITLSSVDSNLTDYTLCDWQLGESGYPELAC